MAAFGALLHPETATHPDPLYRSGLGPSSTAKRCATWQSAPSRAGTAKTVAPGPRWPTLDGARC
jgi:hypothetical protein